MLMAMMAGGILCRYLSTGIKMFHQSISIPIITVGMDKFKIIVITQHIACQLMTMQDMKKWLQACPKEQVQTIQKMGILHQKIVGFFSICWASRFSAVRE